MNCENSDFSTPLARPTPHRSSLDESLGSGTRPRTATVLIWLSVAAIIISYLCAYAFANALVASDLLQRWPRGHDPRPRWMLFIFTGLWLMFVSVGAYLRWISRRQLQRIDAMANEVD